MPVTTTQSAASERIVSAMNGWMMLIVNFALLLGAAFMASRLAEFAPPCECFAACSPSSAFSCWAAISPCSRIKHGF